MSRDESAARGQRYTVGTGNIITGGKIQDSSIVTVGVTAEGQQPAWLPPLRAELARLRVLLEEVHDPAISADDRDDAIGAVRALETEAASAVDSGQADPKGFRWRVKALIGILAPVADIVGGVAALEMILRHL